MGRVGKTSKKKHGRKVNAALPGEAVQLQRPGQTKGDNDNKLSVLFYTEAILNNPHRAENPMIEFLRRIWSHPSLNPTFVTREALPNYKQNFRQTLFNVIGAFEFPQC